jgi:hypothetical protein
MSLLTLQLQGTLNSVPQARLYHIPVGKAVANHCTHEDPVIEELDAAFDPFPASV